MPKIEQILPELIGPEREIVGGIIAALTEKKALYFAEIYRRQRRKSEIYLLLGCLGFLGIAGLQRVYIEDRQTALLFFITFGFLGIGTAYDVSQAENRVFDFNRALAFKIERQIVN